MKKITICLIGVLLAAVFSSCEKDDDPAPVPIAPILKKVIFPGENDVMPGRPATIRGLGFDPSDKVFIEDEQKMTEVQLLSVTDEAMVIMVPADAGGVYTVTIERAGKQTTLDGELKVPFVIVLEDMVMPTTPFAAGATVSISAEGFEAGDMIQLTAPFYPVNKVISIPTTVTPEGISFQLPADAYGINTVIASRGTQRKTILGTIGIQVSVGDEVGGGVVYYTDNNKLHGYIVNKSNTGTPTQQFGPSAAIAYAAGTSKDLGAGKTNTSKLVAKMISFRQNFSNWNNKKTAAELCDELSVTENGDVYDDWFLPSRQELIEMFKVKSMLATHGASVPANNYWSSSEGDGDAAGWSAFYVNFYEATQVVSGNSDKEGWQIGIRAIRAF
ncbi:IPT/TIG domain-containing protein [Pseudoflavitalea rhizosphaerae]|uniref:IPT/TIG domain-containing protein n=1 Tax=Pseudoflavitalea rhizosphaerae TaxID=1884793 RepID=UPI000F8E3F0D|nr:IPT/TIG domain-containing protein [Pseudoflavitalea rhizosphaerae]